MLLRVKELREAKGWNQTVLAYHAGLSPSQVSLIETGKRNPSATTLRGIADALAVDVGDLFAKAQAPPSSEPTFNDVLEEEERHEDLDKLRDLLADAGASTTYLALPDTEFEGLWKDKSVEQRAQINRELLEERRLVKPLLVRWASLPPGSRERKQLYRLWLQVYLVRLLTIAVEKNQEAAQTEADAARRAGNEALAREVLEEARKFAEVA